MGARLHLPPRLFLFFLVLLVVDLLTAAASQQPSTGASGGAVISDDSNRTTSSSSRPIKLTEGVAVVQQRRKRPGTGTETNSAEEDPEGEPPAAEPDHLSSSSAAVDEDSDVSEERPREQFIHDVQRVLPDMGGGNHHGKQQPHVSVISSAFNNRKSFSCPKSKPALVTGTSVADLSPEDIRVIAALGDSLATGVGLWPNTNIEFRGAAFPSGGDATIDGLVTIPNILREFNSRLEGVSHGMGTRDELPVHQLNIAEANATSKDMPAQAKELVARLHKNWASAADHWTLVIMVVGTEEVCASCEGPDEQALLDALLELQSGISKALVVLLGPIHVSSAYKQKANLLKARCTCSRNQSDQFMVELSHKWTSAFAKLQQEFDSAATTRPTFGVLALPMLTITSRYPYALFVSGRPLLNRRGHNYATKWLWNRLIAGQAYNLSSAVLSQDAYFCPAMGCPYFRTPANEKQCRLLRYEEAAERDLLDSHGNLKTDAQGKPRRRTRKALYTVAVVAITSAFVMAICVGTFFYLLSKRAEANRYGTSTEPVLAVDPPANKGHHHHSHHHLAGKSRDNEPLIGRSGV